LEATTGPRRAEALGLTWDDLHLDEDPLCQRWVRQLVMSNR